MSENTPTELLPCPFCNQRLVHNGPFSTRNAKCFVHPQDIKGVDYGRCPASGFRLFDNDPERIKLWNDRPATVAHVDWTEPLEAARFELCEFLVRVADDRHTLLVHVDLSKRLREAEQALTILGEIANSTRSAPSPPTVAPEEVERVRFLEGAYSLRGDKYGDAVASDLRALLQAVEGKQP